MTDRGTAPADAYPHGWTVSVTLFVRAVRSVLLALSWAYRHSPDPEVGRLANRDARRSVPDGGTPVRWFALLRLLADRRTRYVLYYLARRDSRPVRLERLARQVAAWEWDVSVDEVPEDAYERTFVELVQTNLPALATAGVVEYEPIGLMAGLADVPESLASLLRVAAELETSRT
ncbi:DUF7344 domain-containing protein [Halomicrococcus sp. SG-WS-1]|uniref:DUF7344 domain-containing protein n=1 Tax=Halomicrococcus sp. SG-WS-1 TaxID=3439057 RepID=UPI003F79FEC7